MASGVRKLSSTIARMWVMVIRYLRLGKDITRQLPARDRPKLPDGEVDLALSARYDGAPHFKDETPHAHRSSSPCSPGRLSPARLAGGNGRARHRARLSGAPRACNPDAAP